jgi:hypothetical protein
MPGSAQFAALSAPGETWSAIRVSYGLCGIIIMDKDVLPVADYLEEHQVHTHARTHTHTNTHTYTHTHTHTHTHRWEREWGVFTRT